MGVSYSKTEKQFWLRRVEVHSKCYIKNGYFKIMLFLKGIQIKNDINIFSNKEPLFEYYKVIIAVGA